MDGRPPSKLNARLHLALSTSAPSFEVARHNVRLIRDITSSADDDSNAMTHDSNVDCAKPRVAEGGGGVGARIDGDVDGGSTDGAFEPVGVETGMCMTGRSLGENQERRLPTENLLEGADELLSPP